jgi:hypothetical protein
VEWIYLAYDRDQWWVLINIVYSGFLQWLSKCSLVGKELDSNLALGLPSGLIPSNFPKLGEETCWKMLTSKNKEEVGE